MKKKRQSGERCVPSTWDFGVCPWPGRRNIQVERLQRSMGSLLPWADSKRPFPSVLFAFFPVTSSLSHWDFSWKEKLVLPASAGPAGQSPTHCLHSLPPLPEWSCWLTTGLPVALLAAGSATISFIPLISLKSLLSLLDVQLHGSLRFPGMLYRGTFSSL